MGSFEGEIQARIHHADLYDPYIWVARIYTDHVAFRSDIKMWKVPDENEMWAADPKFFNKLEKALLYYIDL